VGDAEFTVKRRVILASRVEEREGESPVRCSSPDPIPSYVQMIASYVQIEEAVQFSEAWPIHLGAGAAVAPNWEDHNCN
jgi:hypothetical protein